VKPKAHQTKQASMHVPRFGTQSKQSSKQPFSRGMKTSVSFFADIPRGWFELMMSRLLFLLRIVKIAERWVSASKPPSLRRLGALSPDPQAPAARGFASRPPLASGVWGLRFYTPSLPSPTRLPPPISLWTIGVWMTHRTVSVENHNCAALHQSLCHSWAYERTNRPCTLQWSRRQQLEGVTWQAYSHAKKINSTSKLCQFGTFLYFN